VPELIAKPPLEVEPLTLAGLTLTPVADGPITSIALFPGGAKAAAKALKPLGLAFPEPRNRDFGKKGACGSSGPGATRPSCSAIGRAGDWTAPRDRPVGRLGHPRLTGPAAVAALARLVALDLREAAFPVGGWCGPG
jgi:hypothetical protein